MMINGGMTGLTVWPHQPPTNPYGAYTDFLVPRFAVPAILAALDYRRRIGRGKHLDISRLEVSLQFMAPLLLDYAVNRREPNRMGSPHPAAPRMVHIPAGATTERWHHLLVRVKLRLKAKRTLTRRKPRIEPKEW